MRRRPLCHNSSRPIKGSRSGRSPRRTASSRARGVIGDAPFFAWLEAHGDRTNAALARHLAIRRMLLVGSLDEAENALAGLDPASLPPALRTAHELVAAGLAMRRVRTKTARTALEAARQAAMVIRQPIVTTIWVLMEVADALSHASTRLQAHRLVVGEINDPSVTVISDLEPWWTRGLTLYANHPDKDWSLTDCISFEVMTTRGITDALTADHHFT